MKTTKFCNKCKEEKELVNFHKCKRSGHQSKCKDCMRKYTKENAECIVLASKVCTVCSVEKPIEYFNKDNSRKDGVYTKCKECINKRRKELYPLNKEAIDTRNEKWRLENKDWVNSYNKEKNKKRSKEDPVFRLANNTRHLIRGSFKRACKGVYRKRQRTEDILGCTLEYFIMYLEPLFEEGMTFDNHGHCKIGNCEVWNIDHKIPLATAEVEEDIIRLNHYTNLQPMWATENLKKGKKLIY